MSFLTCLSSIDLQPQSLTPISGHDQPHSSTQDTVSPTSAFSPIAFENTFFALFMPLCLVHIISHIFYFYSHIFSHYLYTLPCVHLTFLILPPSPLHYTILQIVLFISSFNKLIVFPSICIFLTSSFPFLLICTSYQQGMLKLPLDCFHISQKVSVFIPYPACTPLNMPTNMSIKVTQAHTSIIYSMLTPAIIKRLSIRQTSSTLQSITTNQPICLSTSSPQTNTTAITYPTYFHHPLTHLLLHGNLHTTNIYPLPSSTNILTPCPLHLTSCHNTHQQSSFSALHKLHF